MFCSQKVCAVVVGNGEHMWYLSQVKGPAEDDLVEGDMIADCVWQLEIICMHIVTYYPEGYVFKEIAASSWAAVSAKVCF